MDGSDSDRVAVRTQENTQNDDDEVGPNDDGIQQRRELLQRQLCNIDGQREKKQNRRNRGPKNGRAYRGTSGCIWELPIRG